MSLSDLQSVLQTQAASGKLSISQASLNAANLTPAAGFDATLEAAFGLSAPLTVAFSGTVPAPARNILVLTGTASVLGLPPATAQVNFTLQADGVTTDVLVVVSLPATWNVWTTFPMLQTAPFTQLAMTGATLLVATASETTYAWPGATTALSLVKGLNFASMLGLTGPAALIVDLVQGLSPGHQIVLAGTIDASGIDRATGFPAVDLTGTLPGTVAPGTSFDLSLPRVLVFSERDSNGLTLYRMALASTLSVGGKPFSTVQAGLIDGWSAVCLSLLPTQNAITPADIVTLIGVDYTTYLQKLPSSLQAIFSSVGLKSLGAICTLSPLTLQLVSGSIGKAQAQPWPMGPFTLDDMTLNCSVLYPSKAKQVSFSAVATIFPDIFDGLFDFELVTDMAGGLSISAAFTGSASYPGSVKLAALVSGIAGQPVDLPECLQNLAFEEFGIICTAAGSGYDWQLYGAASDSFQLPLETGPVEIVVQVLIASTGGSKTYQLVGGLVIGDQRFALEIDLGASDIAMSASWTDVGAPLGFMDVAKAFGWTSMPHIPPDLDLALTGAKLTYDFSKGTLVFGAQSRTYGEAAFVSLVIGTAPNTKRLYVFCLATNKSFSLSNLPLVGDQLASVETITIGDLQALIASTPITDPPTLGTINGLIGRLGGTYPPLPSQGVGGVMIASSTLQMGGQTLPLSISLSGGAAQPPALAQPAPTGLDPAAAGPASKLAPAPLPAAGSGSTSGDVTWFDVQRSFGPISIARIGVLYQSNQQALWFELDATLRFGPLTIDLVGLGIGSPLTSFSPAFCLQGLGVAYHQPPLEIAGTLVNLAPPGADFIAFEGGIIVSTTDLSLESFGYYGNKSGFSSMFIFGDFAYPIGGPPAFFVTGGALGFGYNSQLRLPSIDQVHAFPFVQVLPSSTTPNTGLFGSDPTPTKVLDVILKSSPPWVSPKSGDLWFGAGLTFTSFELVNSQAMLFVETGEKLVISLVGDSRARFPQPEPGGSGPYYADIELDLDIRFAPGQGVFSAEAVLAPTSYLLDPACALTGGFAFFVWYGDHPHAGDFVVTLGGYNPGFSPPAWYPKVPIVGFHWAMDASISISGGAYLALTPAAMMVGGRLDATYQSGNLKAWFDAHADFIVRWKPFWFDAGIGITIGASYKLDLLFTTATISVELGCDLEFWGPPTGGTVTVDWYVISFTVPFGTPKQDGQTITGWGDVEAMLPNTGSATARNVLSATPVAGLTPSGTPAASPSPATAAIIHAAGGPGPGPAPPSPPTPATAGPWMVRASQFAFSAATPVPATTVTVGANHAFSGGTFDVFPLGWTGVSSELSITMTGPDGQDVSSAFSVGLSRKGVPSSLWGAPPQRGKVQRVPAGTNQLVADQITGVAVAVLAPRIGATAGPVSVALALASVDLNLSGADLPLSAGASPEGDVSVNSNATVAAIADLNTGIGSQMAQSARAAILQSLTALSFAPTTPNDMMTAFAADAATAFIAEPLLVA